MCGCSKSQNCEIINTGFTIIFESSKIKSPECRAHSGAFHQHTSCKKAQQYHTFIKLTNELVSDTMNTHL